MTDKMIFGIKGIIELEFYKKDKLIKKEHIKNIALLQTEELIRNLTFGDTEPVIQYLIIGTENCSPESTSSYVDPVFFYKAYNDKNKITDDDGTPGIEYQFIINETEANDNSDNADEYQTITWKCLGLSGSTDKTQEWTYKRKDIIKDNETKVIVRYKIFFNLYQESHSSTVS